MNTTASQQSFFNVQNVMGGLSLVMGLCLSQTSAAQQSGKTASPFGLELGQATCALARAQLSPVQEQKLDDGDLLIESLNPQNLYAGTKKIVARCHESRVIAVHMVADKGGMGNPAAGEAFTSLKKNTNWCKEAQCQAWATATPALAQVSRSLNSLPRI